MTPLDRGELGLLVSLNRLFEPDFKYARTEDTVEAQLDEQLINGEADRLDAICGVPS